MKTYNQFCGVAKALDVVGERWTLLLVRDLLLGPRRYSALLSGLPGLTTNLLARRLRHLQAEGLIEKGADGAYALTAEGRALEPVVLALGRFGARYLLQGPGADEQTSVRWAMVSLKRRYQRSPRARVLVLTVGEAHFTVRIGGEALEVADGERAMAPDARLRGAPPGVDGAAERRAPPGRAARRGRAAPGGRPTDRRGARGVGGGRQAVSRALSRRGSGLWWCT